MLLTEHELKAIIREGVYRLMEANGYGQSEEHPAVYVGTYGKYNNGSLEGGWVNLDDFSSKEEFLKYCVQKLHANERDAELMFQDYENVPEGFIGESWVSDKLWDFINIDEPWEVKMAVANGLGNAEEAINVLESGDYRVFWGCDSVEDIVYEYLDEGIMPSNPEAYFDYKKFGRECSWDGPMSDDFESIYEEFGVDEDDDEALGEAIIDSMYGGIEHTPKETVERYMDVSAIARDLGYENTYVEFDGGIVELF